MLLVVGRFFGPFAILLLQSIKKQPHQLCWVAGWILFMQMLDMYIIVLPASTRHRRARQHLGFCFPHRDRRHARLSFICELSAGLRFFRSAIRA